MPLPLTGALGTGAMTSLKAAKAMTTSPVAGFADKLGQALQDVEKSQADANSAVTNMLDKKGEVHEAMIALQRADMTFQLAVQIKNKLVQAYQDVMRMPI